MKIFAWLMAVFCFMSVLCVPVYGTELAEDITALCTVLADGKENAALTDNSVYTYADVKELSVECESGIYGVYIKFDKECAPWSLYADGAESVEGEDGFLHQYVAIGGAKVLKLNFEDGTVIADIFVLGQGELPDYVQLWEKADRADIMVCPTHSDDDQLYFAGMIPWCVANGYKVQVVYLTNHLNTHDRPHELLDGLWHCGVKYYPHVSGFPDLYSESFEQAKQSYEGYGYKYDDFVNYYIERLQQYTPLVVAGHDIGGEYGHGMHMLSFHALTEAVELSAENGLWDVPKTYIHLWAENSVVFDWDEPLEYFGGKSAFNISQEGFGYHLSQHRFTGLTNWIYGTDSVPISTAAQIRSLSPCRFGLYRSTVGTDTVSNGLFENLEEYTEQESSEESSVCESSESEDTSQESEETSEVSESSTESSEFTSEVKESESEESADETTVQKTEEKNTETRDMLPVILIAGAVACVLIHIIVKRNNKD